MSELFRLDSDDPSAHRVAMRALQARGIGPSQITQELYDDAIARARQQSDPAKVILDASQGADPVDGVGEHSRACLSMQSSGDDPSDESAYLAALQRGEQEPSVSRVQLYPVGEGDLHDAFMADAKPETAPDPLTKRLVVGEVVDRITLDKLGPGYTADDYIETFDQEARSLGLDFYEEQNHAR